MKRDFTFKSPPGFKSSSDLHPAKYSYNTVYYISGYSTYNHRYDYTYTYPYTSYYYESEFDYSYNKRIWSYIYAKYANGAPTYVPTAYGGYTYTRYITGYGSEAGYETVNVYKYVQKSRTDYGTAHGSYYSVYNQPLYESYNVKYIV